MDLFFQIGRVNSTNLLSRAVFFFGVIAISIMSSVNFQKKIGNKKRQSVRDVLTGR
jgi:uncharacterized membrane protein YiaA